MELQGGLFGNGRAEYDKEPGERWSTARVLITVKAAPQPSATHGDTVCVAGIRITNDGPEWIRLYPVPFRNLEAGDRFKKYELLELPVKPAIADPRPESYKPDLGKLRILDHLKAWKARNEHVAPLLGHFNACEIYRRAKAGDAGPSLAAVVPKEVGGLKLTPHPGWSDEQLTKMEKDLNQGALFGGPPITKAALVAPRYIGHYQYRCYEKVCNGHSQSILDWEFTELQRRHSQDTDEYARQMITKRFLDQLCAPARGPVFFLGNQAKRHHTFGVLGIYAAEG